MDQRRDMDIIKNLKTIEWLKSEMLTSLASLYELLLKGEEDIKEDLEECISDIILYSYLLGRRLGLDYEDIDAKLKNKVKINILENHKIEKWYGDLTQLMEFIRSR
ncbi:MAG: hypothetical protein GXY88_05105 [Tissierellia bacterium]|nr:hypothetical protein [Tissierellia bacterium]